jgi:hypothetical protein
MHVFHWINIDGMGRYVRFDGSVRFNGFDPESIALILIISQVLKNLTQFSTFGCLSEACSSIKRFSTGFFDRFIVGKKDF